MKKLITIILLIIPAALFAPVIKTEYLADTFGINPYKDLLEAMEVVESKRNPLALNYEKGGYSVGILQIRQAKLEDFNRGTGKNYSLEDCFDPEISREIFYWHCTRYGPTNLQAIARAWNGSGEATKEYWNNVKNILHDGKAAESKDDRKN